MSVGSGLGSTEIAGYMEAARSFFEPQFRLMDLGQGQIDAQSLAELKDSLDRVNLAIANPGQFGTLGIKFSASARAIIARTTAEGTITVGALPILIERKRLILDRIRVLVPQEQLEEFLGTIEEKVKDPQVRQELSNLLSGYMVEQQRIAQEAEKVAYSDLDLALHEVEIRERKWRMRKSLLEREPVAVLIGGLLLFLLTGSLVVGMFMKIQAPEILANAFLLILGFFFGQSASGGGKPERSGPAGTPPVEPPPAGARPDEPPAA